MRDQIIDRNNYQNIIGESEAIKKMFNLMHKVENIKIPVLVTGRNGSGKELVANALHYNSNRRAGRSWDIPLANNRFIMFPSTQMYYITNNQKDSLNFILTTTYEFI